MKTKFIILFLSFVISSNNLFAQNVLQVKPPSAEVASLGKYIDQPVSLNSGLVDISIPIYNFKEGQLEIPISLSYYSGGIKVEETASKVGLGWNLNAGGVVSRTIKQLPDDAPTGYMYTTHTVNEFRIGINNAQFTNEVTNSLDSRDYEPDSFMFSFLNYSGRFYYNKSIQSFMQIPFSNIKITPIFNVNNTISSWIFTDEKGIKYYFGNTNDTDNRSQVERQFSVTSYNYNSEVGITGQTSNTDYISSWFLVKIESPKKDLISLFYQESDFYDEIIKTESSIFKCYDSNSSNYNHRDENYLQRKIKETYINKITSKSQEVIFENKIEDRLDAPKTKALGNIFIKAGNILLKKYSFNYDYFISPDIKFNWVIGDRSSSVYRLRLNTIQEENALGQKLPPFKFSYDPMDLPNKTSYAQDAWGYYNGERSNSSLIPQIVYYGKGIETTIGSANRAVNESYAKAGILTKIEYPTGSSRAFFYESNQVGLIVNKQENTSFTPIVSRHELLQPPYEDLGNSHLEENPMAQLKDLYSKEFEIKNRVSDFKVFIDVEGVTGENLYATDAHFTFRIYGVTDPNFYMGLGSRQNNPKLPDGKYIIEAKKQSYPISRYGFTVALSWDEKKIENEDEGEKVGGLRIKKIITSDSNGNDLIKEFDYKIFLSKKSSGYCINYPFFLEKNYFPNFSNSYKLSSQSQLPSVNLSKSVVAYENVTEFDINATNEAKNGKIEYTYLANFTHDDLGYQAIGNGKMNDKTDKYIGWKVGNLLQVDTYAKRDAIFKRIESKINEYESFGTSIIPDFGVMIETRGYFYDAIGIAYILYPISSQWFRPKFSKSISYFNEKTLLETTESYTYNNNPLLFSQVIKSNSKNEKLETNYFYPQDSQMASEPFVKELIAQNRIGEPLNVQTFRRGIKLSEQKTVYDKSIATSNLLLPSYILENKGKAALNPVTDKKISYDFYDDRGNLLQYTQDGGTPTSIVWGYDKTLPVAKVDNIAYKNIQTYLVNGVQNASSWDKGTEGDMIIALNRFWYGYSGLYNTLITTYAYKPLVGISRMRDINGTMTYYDYDDFNRLKFVKDNDQNVLQAYFYNYKGQVMDISLDVAPVYRNTAISKTFYRANCSSGLTGPLVYSVSAGTYTSVISQQDADNKALNDMNMNGQVNANRNGYCAFWNKEKSGVFTKNNCASGTAGTSVVYTVPAMTSYSLTSQAAADEIAQISVNKNGQAYANANGSCMYLSNELSGYLNMFSEYLGMVKVAYIVPAGEFSSTISQDDADNQAQEGLSQCWQEFSCSAEQYQDFAPNIPPNKIPDFKGYDCKNVVFTIMQPSYETN